jgi:hypothetical protein
MKTRFLIASIILAATAAAQEVVPLQLWADQQRLGPVKQTIADTGLVEELRLDLQGEVSSLEVGEGYTVILYDRENGTGVNTLELVGPCQVNDLETLPLLGLRRTWDDAVASVHVRRTRGMLELPPALAESTP